MAASSTSGAGLRRRTGAVDHSLLGHGPLLLPPPILDMLHEGTVITAPAQHRGPVFCASHARLPGGAPLDHDSTSPLAPGSLLQQHVEQEPPPPRPLSCKPQVVAACFPDDPQRHGTRMLSVRAGHYWAFVQRGMFSSPGVDAAIAAARTATAPLATGDAQDTSPADGGCSDGGGSSSGPTAYGGHGDANPQALPWWKVSDQSVKKVRWADVAACQAYLLVYVRC